MDARTPIESSRGVVVLSASFNLNCDCFVVATNNGFSVFDAGTCKQLAKRYLTEGGVGLIQIFGRSNIMALVGGSRKPIRIPTKAVIWDEKKSEFTREITCTSRIRGLRALGRKVVVLLEEEVRIYRIDRTPELEASYPTAANPLGLCSVSRTHLAFPDAHQVTCNYILPAHASALGALALSRDGTLLATASEKGTLVRVWATANSARVAELRRGVDQVTIFSLGFNPSNTMLACTSDKGTLHIFDVPYSGGGGGVESNLSSNNNKINAYFESRSVPSETGEWTTYEGSDAGLSLASDPIRGGGGPGSTISDPGSTANNNTTGANNTNNTANNGNGRWGMLGKLPFMPQYFRDTVSFASAEFALYDMPGTDWQYESAEAATMRWSRLPKGTLGWTKDDIVVVLGAGIEPKYERFIITTGAEGRRICVRQAWANYMSLD